jgi:hypothetical protein
MLTKKKILQKVKNMKFFNGNLDVVQEKVDKLNKDNSSQVTRFETELKISFKLKTIHSYLQLPTTYDILENPHQIITKNEFKIRVTSKEYPSEDGIVVFNTPKFKATAFHMEEEEFDLYVECYKELSK